MKIAVAEPVAVPGTWLMTSIGLRRNLSQADPLIGHLDGRDRRSG